jgi:aryl-alcohol dehydrogenase-like predicted oxidoreductase
MSATRGGLELADVPPIGLGCMNLSHAYASPPPRAHAERLLHRAFEIGLRHFDTAALYGFGGNEELVGAAMKAQRASIYLASKCGITGVEGKRIIDGRPESILATCDESLRRLQTDVIDLYYLHRWDRSIPIEESMGGMQRLVESGKVRHVGLSEVSAATLRRAHAVHPVAAVQSEYSLWSRNVEIGVLKACAELGATFVAFSPLARGFLTDVDLVPEDFSTRDVRRGMPRFQAPHFPQNAALLPAFRKLAAAAGCSAAQLALVWLLERHPGMHAIPGTRSLEHLAENVAALDRSVPDDVLDRAEELINSATVSGPRYNATTQTEIDTEEFTYM